MFIRKKTISLFLAAALLVLALPGCDQSLSPTSEVPGVPDTPTHPAGLDPLLIGSWHSNYKGPTGEYEGYTISADTLTYHDGSGGWPAYIEIWDDGRNPIPGPFFGIYYDYLNEVGDFVIMANSTTLVPVYPQVLYDPPETKTLEEAIAKFTLVDKDKFVANVAIPQFKDPRSRKGSIEAVESCVIQAGRDFYAERQVAAIN